MMRNGRTSPVYSELVTRYKEDWSVIGLVGCNVYRSVVKDQSVKGLARCIDDQSVMGLSVMRSVGLVGCNKNG